MVAANDNINRDGEKKTVYYPVAVRRHTVNTRALCREATRNTTLSPHELELALKLVAEQIVTELLHSNHVCINGFGTFSLSVESRPVDHPDKVRAASIDVKRLLFKPSPACMQELRKAVFERVKP